jgi:hypothetical protein
MVRTRSGPRAPLGTSQLSSGSNSWSHDAFRDTWKKGGLDGKVEDILRLVSTYSTVFSNWTRVSRQNQGALAMTRSIHFCNLRTHHLTVG